MKREDYLCNFDLFFKRYKRKICHYAKEYRLTNAVIQNSALLVVDMQRFFLELPSHAFIPSAPRIIPNIQLLMDFFRRRELPIILTKYALNKNEKNNPMSSWWADELFEADVRSEIVDEISQLDNQVIVKRGYSAFHKTSLEKNLKMGGIKNLFISGVMTHLCCDSTARDAFQHGFSVYFVADATATYNEELHFSSLMTISHGFAIPILTREVLQSEVNDL